MKKITQKEFDNLPVENGFKICPGNTDYSQINTKGELCSFGKLCSFTTLVIQLLNSTLCDLSDKLTLELMRRDAQFHPDPKLFDKWAKVMIARMMIKFAVPIVLMKKERYGSPESPRCQITNY